jgi:ethanolamine transporter
VLAPAVGIWLMPVFDGFYNIFGIDPSILPASVLANDMGGMQLSQVVCKDAGIGNFNAFVTSSMMGCVISFTIPFSLGLVKKEQHKELFMGILCGIVTIPVGSFVAGLICRLNPLVLLINLIPLIVISVIIVVGLLVVPKICVKCFAIVGVFMRSVAIVGLLVAIFTFLTKIEINPYFDSFENAAFICANACVTLSGMLPFMFVLTKLFNKPLGKLSGKIGINETSTIAFLGTLATNASTFGVMDKMDKKGALLNSAFAVSASFMFGSHLAFTMAYDSRYITPMIIGKLVSGISAVICALIVLKKNSASTQKSA